MMRNNIYHTNIFSFSKKKKKTILACFFYYQLKTKERYKIKDELKNHCNTVLQKDNG